MPAKVDDLFKEIKKDNPSYSDEQAWATAWSVFCKHVDPDSDHCHQKEYLKGKEAGVIVRVASRFMEAASMDVGKWYLLKTHSEEERVYYKPLTVQKNGGFSGVMVTVDLTKPRAKPKAKKNSQTNSPEAWKELKEVPPAVESAASSYKSAGLVSRVARRFAGKSAAIDIMHIEGAKGDIAEGVKTVEKALSLAKKAESELGKYEREAKDLHQDAAKALEKVKGAVEKLTLKATPTLAALIEKDIQTIKHQNWTAALSTDSGLTQFVIHTFGAMQKALSRYRSMPEVLEVQKVLQSELQPVRADLQKVQDRFEKEFDKYGLDITDLLDEVEIFSYRNQETAEMSSFNHNRDMVKINTRSLTVAATRLPETLAGVVDRLTTMKDLLHKIEGQIDTIAQLDR